MAGTFEGEEDIEDASAQAMQADAVAYAAWGKAECKGKAMRKGKGEGKGKGSKGNNPSVEERKKKLAELNQGSHKLPESRTARTLGRRCSVSEA